MHKQTYMYTHTHKHTSQLSHSHMHTYIHMPKEIFGSSLIFQSCCIINNVHTHTHTHIHMYTHTHTHKKAHTHTHTHTHTQRHTYLFSYAHIFYGGAFIERVTVVRIGIGEPRSNSVGNCTSLNANELEEDMDLSLLH